MTDMNQFNIPGGVPFNPMGQNMPQQPMQQPMQPMQPAPVVKQKKEKSGGGFWGGFLGGIISLVIVTGILILNGAISLQDILVPSAKPDVSQQVESLSTSVNEIRTDVQGVKTSLEEIETLKTSLQEITDSFAEMSYADLVQLTQANEEDIVALKEVAEKLLNTMTQLVNTQLRGSAPQPVIEEQPVVEEQPAPEEMPAEEAVVEGSSEEVPAEGSMEEPSQEPAPETPTDVVQ